MVIHHYYTSEHPLKRSLSTGQFFWGTPADIKEQDFIHPRDNRGMDFITEVRWNFNDRARKDHLKGI